VTTERQADMKVRGIVWVGTRTDRFDETVRFFGDVLGVPFVSDRPDFAFGQMPDSSVMEVFGPSDHDHTEFTTGPVPEFLVDDLRAGLEELRGAGVEILGEPMVDGPDGWVHFRAPDGNVYGLVAGPIYRR
jgi:catechol 2,3-dioxygenase-like lactoylglutathione lyase family enzyme